jgi:Na+(H+)/acetate symporter ActP
MQNNKSKVKKPLIIVTFIIMSCLSSIKKMREIFHTNDELKKAFDDGGLAGNYAQYAYILTLMVGSFAIVLLIKALWNRLIPRITNWREIDYFEAMGIVTIILLFSYI